tara:strand:+ start:16770 stop:17093 length:324 start_codon:yes stop_codon:yes gene_type:complete
MQKLSKYEEFLILRRRAKSSREQYAKKKGMTVYRLYVIEEELKNSKDSAKLELEPHEIAFILRKRADLKVKELSKLLNVSKQTILNREAGRRNAQPNIDYLTKEFIC